jgi:hypothetical protein
MVFQTKILLNERRCVLTSLLSLAVLPACTQPSSNQTMPIARTLSPDEQRWKHKFRGLGGGQLFVDAFGEKNGVNIFNENERLFFARGTLSPRNNDRQGYSAEFGVPITLRAEWRDRYESYQPTERIQKGIPDGAYAGGTILGNVTVPVAERIPDAVLDRVRQHGGVLILKLRLSDETLLIGWELGYATGYPFKRDKNGNAYTTDEERMQGGDFCERQLRWVLVDGVIQQQRFMGWYIDKKTGQKIETDF